MWRMVSFFSPSPKEKRKKEKGKRKEKILNGGENRVLGFMPGELMRLAPDTT